LSYSVFIDLLNVSANVVIGDLDVEAAKNVVTEIVNMKG
jgi:hypothetical protein